MSRIDIAALHGARIRLQDLAAEDVTPEDRADLLLASSLIGRVLGRQPVETESWPYAPGWHDRLRAAAAGPA